MSHLDVDAADVTTLVVVGAYCRGGSFLVCCRRLVGYVLVVDRGCRSDGRSWAASDVAAVVVATTADVAVVDVATETRGAVVKVAVQRLSPEEASIIRSASAADVA